MSHEGDGRSTSLEAVGHDGGIVSTFERINLHESNATAEFFDDIACGLDRAGEGTMPDFDGAKSVGFTEKSPEATGLLVAAFTQRPFRIFGGFDGMGMANQINLHST